MVLIRRISLRTFAALGGLCGRKAFKPFTAKSAKNAKITQRVELKTLPDLTGGFIELLVAIGKESGVTCIGQHALGTFDALRRVTQAPTVARQKSR